MTIASMLLLSFCFLPCSGSMSGDKVAGQHHSMDRRAGNHGMQAYMSYSFHKIDLANVVFAKDLSTCDNCKIPVPAVIQSSGASGLIALNVFSNKTLDDLISLPVYGKFLKLGLPPPVYKNNIYILNSTYLI